MCALRKKAKVPGLAGNIPGSCNELLSITGSPAAEIIAQPTIGKQNINPYSST